MAVPGSLARLVLAGRMERAPGVHARLWDRRPRRPSRAVYCSIGRSVPHARLEQGRSGAPVMGSANGWCASCRCLAIGLRLPANRPVRAGPDCQSHRSVCPLARCSRCVWCCRLAAVDSCYWGFAHCHLRYSTARMALGAGEVLSGRASSSPRRALPPVGVRASQKCQAAEADENFPAQRYMVSRQRCSIRPMGVRWQDHSHLAVGVALVADQDSGRGFLR